MWRAVGSPVYTTASVAYDWAGVLMKKPLAKRRKCKRGTDQPTDRPTDTVTYRVALPATKKANLLSFCIKHIPSISYLYNLHIKFKNYYFPSSIQWWNPRAFAQNHLEMTTCKRWP